MPAFAPNLLILAFAAILLIAAALSDFRGYIIPNSICLLLALAFLIHAAVAGDPLLVHLATGAIVLTLGFAAFAARLAGGGDIKLLAATAVWAGPAGLPALLVLTSLAGGLLAAAVLVQQWLLHRRATAVGLPSDRLQALRQAPIPYGIAIAAGGLYVLAGSAADSLR